MGYLKSLGDKRFRIKYDLSPKGGRRRQKTETLEHVTKKEAARILADREKIIARGAYFGDETTTFGDFFEEFMKKKREAAKPRAATTLQAYETLYRGYLGPSFGAMRVSEITSHDVEEALRSWRTGRTTADPRWKKRPPASLRTQKHAYDLLRNVLNVAVRRRVAAVNVLTQIETDEIPAPADPELKALTKEQLRRLLDEAKSPSNRSVTRGGLTAYPAYYPAIAFLAYTGARRGEALALRWADVDLDARTVTIRSSLSDVNGSLSFKSPKNGKSRTINIAEDLAAILTEHRKAQAAESDVMGAAYADDDLVFARPDGAPIRPWNFGATFPDLIRRAGVPKIRLHDLRDTHASLTAQAGTPLEVISKRLGHANIAITAKRYLTVYTDRDAAASDAFAKLLR